LSAGRPAGGRHERPTPATLNYLPSGGMQMIWSGALIEHGWSGTGPVRSEVTVCHGERPRERDRGLTIADRRPPPMVTDNHHPPASVRLMPPVIINAEIARRGLLPFIKPTWTDGLPARLPLRRRLDFEFNYRTGSTGCTGAQLVARCRHLRERTPRPNHSQNVTMFELLKMKSLPMSYFTAQNHVHSIKLRSIQTT